jgi:ABC-type multidrug transport system ATPase subunit
VTVALEWRNLTYTVPVGKGKKKGTKMILDRLTGVAPPGHLLAIMGPTGAA